MHVKSRKKKAILKEKIQFKIYIYIYIFKKNSNNPNSDLKKVYFLRLKFLPQDKNN